MDKRLKGVSASSGIAIGKAHFVGAEEFAISKRKITLEDVPKEILRFEDALISTRREILDLRKEIETKLDDKHAQIFDAHLLVLEDRVLVEAVINQIKNERINVEYAFGKTVQKYVDTFSRLEDQYLRERVADINDVSRRVLQKLLKKEKTSPAAIKEKVIIVAHDLSPADTAALPKKNILGFITDIGGPTSHTAIIARSLGIPAVVGLENATKFINSGDSIIIDGSAGVVVVNPSLNSQHVYALKQKDEKRSQKTSYLLKKSPSETKDKHRVVIAANIELPEEIDPLLVWGAEGIGLYRTEYMFLGRRDLPSEDEQFLAYSTAAKRVAPHPVIIRTLDLGGDKFLSHPDIPRDMHPFLGWRAIRFCLARPDIFKAQLRAILRASKVGNIKIMFPMISGIEELRKAKEFLEQARREVLQSGYAISRSLEVGVMIEVPSAALTSDIIAREVDFFSIGTNDLIQYALAVDRANEKVAYLYDPIHPGVLRLIKMIIENAHSHDIWVGMCGEMASSLLCAVLLLGLELDEFSVPPPVVPKLKRLIRAMSFAWARETARRALEFSSSRETEKFLTETLRKELKGNYEDFLR